VISRRFLPVVCALIAVSLVPTLIHSYFESTVQDGLTTATIPLSLAGYDGRPSGRSSSWGERRFDSGDWTERIYRSGGDEVTLTVVRSYDAKSVYHHPELAVADGPAYLRTELRTFAQGPEIPVRVLYGDTGTVVMYALHYADGFVQDPIRFQLRTAGELLFSGRRAMTLFFLNDEEIATGAAIESLPSLELFFTAIDRFVAADARQR
jgi:hypothetical protein